MSFTFRTLRVDPEKRVVKIEIDTESGNQPEWLKARVEIDWHPSLTKPQSRRAVLLRLIELADEQLRGAAD